MQGCFPLHRFSYCIPYAWEWIPGQLSCANGGSKTRTAGRTEVKREFLKGQRKGVNVFKCFWRKKLCCGICYLSSCNCHKSFSFQDVTFLKIVDFSQGQFVSAFRQAQRRENCLPIVNAGMRVLFAEGTDLILDFSIFYGGIGSTTVCAKQTCQALIGRYCMNSCRLCMSSLNNSPPMDFTCLYGNIYSPLNGSRSILIIESSIHYQMAHLILPYF